MANIVIKELLSSDKISEIVDKLNFNFDQLLLNGGGPIGRVGGVGGIGPIGPRGTIWFTAADLWTTLNSPSWTGTPAKANSQLLPGYPQYKGDPNRFLPIAPVGVLPVAPWVFPENTYTLNTSTKPIRGGDLFLQEGDDTFNSQASTDGDIWEYNATSLNWILTGVNIKGETGSAGSNSSSEWVRETSGSDDIIYPKHLTGQDITRVFLGDHTDVLKKDNSTAILTINTDLTHISLNHTDLHSELINPGNEEFGASIKVSSIGDLFIEGSSIGTSKQVSITAIDSQVNIVSGGTWQTQYLQDPTTSIHSFEGAALEINHPDFAALKYSRHIAPVTVGFTNHIITQSFDTSNFLVNVNTSSDGYGSPSLNIDNAPHLVFQNNSGKNVGIGTYPVSTQPKTKLQVNGSISLGESNNFIGDNVYSDSGVLKPIYSTVAAAAWYLKQNINTNPLADQQLNLAVFPRTINGTPFTGSSGPSYFTIKQNSVTDLGKVGINMLATNLDSRLTVNDTDGTGIHLIRQNSIVSGNTFTGINSGVRMFHETSADSYFDKRFNIIQYESNDFIIANKTDLYPTNDIHARLVIKKESGFIGINTVIPNAPFTLRGRGNQAESLLVQYTTGNPEHPDEVNLGTFEDIYIEGLNTVTTINTGLYAHNQTNIQGGSYIGFNAWVDNPDPLDPNNSVVEFGKVYQQGGSGGSMIFSDKNGNLNFSNFENVDIALPFPNPPLEPNSRISITSGDFVETIKMTINTDGQLILGPEGGSATSIRIIKAGPTFASLRLMPGTGTGGAESAKPHIELNNAVRSINRSPIQSTTYDIGNYTHSWLFPGGTHSSAGSWNVANEWPATTYDRIVYLYASNYADGTRNGYLQVYLGNWNFATPTGYGQTILYVPIIGNLSAVGPVNGGGTFIVPAGSTFSIYAGATTSTTNGFSIGLTIFKFGL